MPVRVVESDSGRFRAVRSGTTDTNLIVPRRQLLGPASIPQFAEAMNPAHMSRLTDPLRNDQIIWKLDHTARVGLIVGDTHREVLGSSRDQIVASQRAGIAHDCGQVTEIEGNNVVLSQSKVDLTNKWGLYTPEDWRTVHEHPRIAADYLARNGEHVSARDVFYHHTMQGTRSYPFALDTRNFDRSELTSIALFAAADVTDAGLVKRPYTKWELDSSGQPQLTAQSTDQPWTSEKTRGILEKDFGKLLEGEVLDFIVARGQHYAGKTIEDLAQAA